MCRAKPGQCELVVKNEDENESKRLIEEHIVAEHFEVFMKPWEEDPYDYIYTDTHDNRGQILHHICLELVDKGTHFDVCGELAVTRAEIRMHLMGVHRVELQAGAACRHRALHPAQQLHHSYLECQHWKC